MRVSRRSVDPTGYEDRVRNGPCFIYGIVQGAPNQPESVILRNRDAIVFLSRPSAQLGHTLVAPIAHQIESSTTSRVRRTSTSRASSIVSAAP
jgi:hypothetical protein